MSTREERVLGFADTMRHCQTDPELITAISEARAKTEIIPEDFYPEYDHTPRFETEVTVTQNRSFEAVINLKKEYPEAKTAVLNFANPVEPGGGVKRGAMAQEESLCRSINLYFSLVRPDVLEQYYRVHQGLQGYAFSDRLIYSPGVTVFKSDDTIPVRLEQPFRVDVITCAAPYCGFGLLPDLDGIFERRIKAVLEAAIKREVQNLVLGAWGCGAFCNPPQLVADAFSRVLVAENYRMAFDRVVFSIVKGPARNLAVFEQTFPAQE